MSWLRAADDAALISVRVTPKASADRIEGIAAADDGSERLAVRVRAVPDKGAANKAVAVTLAKALGVARGDVSVVSGATSRLKTVRVAGDPQEIAARVRKLVRT